MQYCQQCVMPNTRPNTKLDENNVCLACHNYEKRKEIVWNERWEVLIDFTDFYKRNIGNNSYNCAIAVSGGKDSHYLVYLIKEKLGMSPLLIRVGDGFSNTISGTRNIRNLSDTFDCDMVQFDLSIAAYRKLTRYCFETYANFPFVDGLVYTYPVQIAQNYGIKLLIYGEDPGYEFGTSEVEHSCATDHVITNQGLMTKLGLNIISHKEIMPIFMSFYVPWDGYDNYLLAKQYGFRDLTHEWIREGHCENFDQIDIVGWEVSHFLKYVKFGYGRVTDIASRWIREGRITREKAIELVNEHDGKLDQKTLDDFLSFTGYTVREFWAIVEKWWNKDIFEQKNRVWTKKKEYKLK